MEGTIKGFWGSKTPFLNFFLPYHFNKSAPIEADSLNFDTTKSLFNCLYINDSLTEEKQLKANLSHTCQMVED